MQIFPKLDMYPILYGLLLLLNLMVQFFRVLMMVQTITKFSKLTHLKFIQVGIVGKLQAPYNTSM